MSQGKRTLLALVSASLLILSMSVAPAFAFIHAFVPAEDCAVSDQAADNETAEAQLLAHVQVPVQTPPAPDDCPAPQK